MTCPPLIFQKTSTFVFLSSFAVCQTLYTLLPLLRSIFHRPLAISQYSPHSTDPYICADYPRLENETADVNTGLSTDSKLRIKLQCSMCATIFLSPLAFITSLSQHHLIYQIISNVLCLCVHDLATRLINTSLRLVLKGQGNGSQLHEDLRVRHFLESKI